MSLPTTQHAIEGDQDGQPIFKDKPLPKPSENQVIVKIEFAPINPTDFLKLKGFYGTKDLIGAEGSGTVVAIGDNLKVSHKIGDRVHIVGPGCFAQYIVANSENLYTIQQDDLSFEDASSHFVNPATAYYMGALAERGGHKAVIHTAASSALGRMLIRHLKTKGIKSINIVRKDGYIEELKKEGADYVLNCQAPDFEAQFKEIAEKEKATIAFDAIGGDFVNKILKGQPPNSTLYVYGILGGSIILNGIELLELLKKKSVTGLYLTHYIQELGPEGFRSVMKEIHSLLPTVFKTKVLKTMPLSEIKEAMASSIENSSKGKILLKPN